MFRVKNVGNLYGKNNCCSGIDGGHFFRQLKRLPQSPQQQQHPIRICVDQQKMGMSTQTMMTNLNTNKNNVDPNSDDYQFLQKTTTPMLHFQRSLPRLPIPELNKTCERYLAALRPLISDNDYQNSEKLVNDFRTIDGPKLQELLKASDIANKHTSYISEPWFEMYLKDRKPLPINYNVPLIMKPDHRPEYNNQLVRTTNLVISTLRFRRSLRSNLLKPEVYHMNPKKSDTPNYHTITRMAPQLISTYVSYAFKAFPLDMSQYQGLFNATRIPEQGKDSIYRNSSENIRHIIVMKGGHFYAVDVLDKSGNIEPPSVIQTRLNYILTKTDDQHAEYPVGVLTTENRDIWAKIRKHMINIDGKNDNLFNEIDSSLFFVCLDDDKPLDMDNPIPTIRNMLANDGTNRWFDKSISLLVGVDGTAAVSFEHSWGDGVAVLRYFNEIYSDTIKSPFLQPNTKPTETLIEENNVRSIVFSLDDNTKHGILQAKKNHENIMKSLAIDFLLYPGMDKNFCKKYRLSPDSIMQLGFQLAFRKQYNKYVGTYESCSTAAFRHGRTETIRPCTVATKLFCEEILSCAKNDKKMNKEQLRTMIDDCSKAHGHLTKEAAMGQGFDRHLFGLKNIAQLNGLNLPAIYHDDAFAKLNHNVISTSTLSSPGILLGAFGPVVKDGFGISYSIQEDKLGAIVSSYPSDRDGSGFVECLKEAYDNIKTVVDSTSK